MTGEEQLGRAVRAERLRRGLDQRDVAVMAGVGLSAVRRLEAGNGSTLRTTFAVLTALGVRTDLDVPDTTPVSRRRAPALPTEPIGLHRREDRTSWHLHRAVAAKLRTPHARAVLDRARDNLPALRANVRGPSAHQWLDQWEHALAGPVPDLIAFMLRTDPEAVDLRQVSPFAGVLSGEERAAAIRRAVA